MMYTGRSSKKECMFSWDVSSCCCRCHYTGKLASNNRVFDSSYERGRPLTFKVSIDHCNATKQSEQTWQQQGGKWPSFDTPLQGQTCLSCAVTKQTSKPCTSGKGKSVDNNTVPWEGSDADLGYIGLILSIIG